MNKLAKNLLSIFITFSIVFGAFFAPTVLAVNEQFDDPNDNLISQNESYDDLLHDEFADAPQITGSSYILYDAQSDTILLGRNIDSALNPATTSIIMTVLLALENLELDDTIIIDQAMYIGIPEGLETLGLTEGEEVTVRDMIYGALLKSANDACLALAIKISGSEALFADLMNRRAAELGCTNSNFISCYGITNGIAYNTSTSHDLALILKECIKHQDFVSISTSFQHTMPATNLYGDSRIISNANRFISTQEYSYDYYVGGKTGYSDGIGYTQVAAAERNGRELIAVILGATSSESRYSDTIELFEYGYNSFTTMPIEPSEFMTLFDDTIDQINGALLDTDLAVINTSSEYSSYLTTTTFRVSQGCTNTVDLSNVIIDTSLDEQTFDIPVCKSYSDKTYIVGVLHLEIGTKDKVVPINPTKTTPMTNLKTALIAVSTVIVLIIILLVSLLVFRKNLRKKHEEDFRNRNKML